MLRPEWQGITVGPEERNLSPRHGTVSLLGAVVSIALPRDNTSIRRMLLFAEHGAAPRVRALTFDAASWRGGPALEPR